MLRARTHILVILALVASSPALAHGATAPTMFAGDRYSGTLAQGASAGDVVRSIRASRKYRSHRRHRRLNIGRGIIREAIRAFGPRPAAWCGWWLGHHLGMPDRRLWLARNWATVGTRAHGPQVGAVVVWPHHVGKITAVDGHRIRVLSGNDGRAVRDRWRTVRGVIAYRVL